MTGSTTIQQKNRTKATFVDGVLQGGTMGFLGSKTTEKTNTFSSMAGKTLGSIALTTGIQTIANKKLKFSATLIAGGAQALITGVSLLNQAREDGKVDRREIANIAIQSGLSAVSTAGSVWLGSKMTSGKSLSLVKFIGISALDAGIGAGSNVASNGLGNVLQGRPFKENQSQAALLGAASTLVGHTISSARRGVAIEATPTKGLSAKDVTVIKHHNDIKLPKMAKLTSKTPDALDAQKKAFWDLIAQDQDAFAQYVHNINRSKIPTVLIKNGTSHTERNDTLNYFFNDYSNVISLSQHRQKYQDVILQNRVAFYIAPVHGDVKNGNHVFKRYKSNSHNTVVYAPMDTIRRHPEIKELSRINTDCMMSSCRPAQKARELIPTTFNYSQMTPEGWEIDPWIFR